MDTRAILRVDIGVYIRTMGAARALILDPAPVGLPEILTVAGIIEPCIRVQHKMRVPLSVASGNKTI